MSSSRPQGRPRHRLQWNQSRQEGGVSFVCSWGCGRLLFIDCFVFQIAAIKVVVAGMACKVIDRAIQVSHVPSK